MNLKPIIGWGVKVLNLFETGNPTDEIKGRLGCIIEHKELITELAHILQVAYAAQKLIKNQGLDKGTYEKCLKLFPKNELNGNMLLYKKEVDEYLSNMLRIEEKLNADKILCSSDILESTFGKYKNYVSNNKTIGITDLSLSIPAFLNNFSNKNAVTDAMEKTKVEDIKQWKSNNIGKSVLEARNEIFKPKPNEENTNNM